MKIKSVEFITSAVKPSQYPDEDLPEIAFVGRSNVGKSSMINVLVNRKKLVKTSSTPGKTQLINFFNINKEFSFVDLPGFGYAKVPRQVQKNWIKMVKTYISTRKTLKGIVLLIDIRREPKQEEEQLIDWFNSIGLPVLLILTKADKLSKTKQIHRLTIISKQLNLSKQYFIFFSAKSRLGKQDIWDALNELIQPSENQTTIDN